MITKPKGTVDITGSDSLLWEYIDYTVANVMANYNYEYIRTPIFENSELFHRSVGESSDIVRKETYDFLDKGERNITLRPEGTAGVVRSYLENKVYAEPDVKKYYYNGTMYRYERPQSGRLREFTQFGVEVLGSNDPIVDAEVISLQYRLLETFHLNNLQVNINSLGDNESRMNYKKALVDYLLERKLTISCAESCTGGQIAAAITAVSGCSAVFPGGVCTYSEEMKIKMLGVKRETLDTYGVVSPQTALEMARGVRSLTGSDIAVATTGIAGPSGGTSEQPVGTVCIAIVRDEDECAWCENFAAGEEAARTEIQRRAVRKVLEEVMKQLEKA